MTSLVGSFETTPEPRPSTKPLSTVWNHYTSVKNQTTGKKTASCNYCRKELYPHCDRMKRHLHICPALGKECQEMGVDRAERLADISSDKKIKPRKEPTIVVTGSNGGTPSTNAGIKRSHGDSSSDEDDEECIGDGNEEDKEETMRLLAKLIKSKDLTVTTDRTSHATKSVRQMSNDELDRETRELTVKKLRLDVDLREKQTRLYDKISKGIGKFMKAADAYLESQGARVTVYTGTAGDTETSILQTAYEATMTDTASIPEGELSFDPSKANVSYSALK